MILRFIIFQLFFFVFFGHKMQFYTKKCVNFGDENGACQRDEEFL